MTADLPWRQQDKLYRVMLDGEPVVQIPDGTLAPSGNPDVVRTSEGRRLTGYWSSPGQTPAILLMDICGGSGA